MSAAGSGGERQRILFTTSNGTGLGHLTRSMAIARRLPEGIEPLFLTLSAAAPVVEQMGFAVEYVASYATPASGNDYRWSRRLRARLRAAIAEAEPEVVVFDGTHPYEALLGALPAQTTAVWCRRPLWKRGSSRVPLGRAAAFDAVLEPGELAESEDAGPTVALRDRAFRVEPIVLVEAAELLSRPQAEAELGLEPGLTTVLVTLGQGPGVAEANRRTIARLAAHEGVQVAALSSALAAVDSVPDGVVQLRATYPMSRYFRAFDGAVAAAGYNAYHELIALGVPSLFVPMPRDTDDQAARARWAQRAGVGLALGGPADPELEARLERLLDPAERQANAARLAELAPPAGAAAAAAWLAELAVPASSTTQTSPATPASPATRAERPKTGHIRPKSATRSGWRDFRRRWGSFVASAPRTVVRLTRQQLTKPRARVVVLAVGIEDRDPVDAVRAAIEAAGEQPRRTLVVTDALGSLGDLRALGAGLEHVPAAGSRQAELAAVPYEAFLARRLELIRAERPAARVVVAGGSTPPPSVP